MIFNNLSKKLQKMSRFYISNAFPDEPLKPIINTKFPGPNTLLLKGEADKFTC
jgi:tRNA A37 threonylcarbamoyladenosine synthetase subunit TsaC/SUA5/YrdC